MKQYNLIKARYPGALLLFRVGDFYETFGEDAVKASKILDIVLTKRSNGAAGDVPLAGFPHHSLDAYLPKLVRAGERVAICDQLEDPKVAQGIVKRGVTELVTPGVSFHDNVLDGKRNNYLCALHFGVTRWASPSSTCPRASFFASQGDAAYIDKLLQSFSPSEVLVCKQKKKDFAGLFGDKYNAYHLDDWVFGYPFCYEKLTTHFQTAYAEGLRHRKRPGGRGGGGLHPALPGRNRAPRGGPHRQDFAPGGRPVRVARQVHDPQPRTGVRAAGGGVPLLQILDQTVTPMGSRLLRKWVVLPLKEKVRIEERLDTVAFLVANPT
jgi:DNA mismatch repair protein MutS